MATSAFVVKVPEAEPMVADLRQQYDPSTRVGVPAHITVLYPFMAPEHITPSVLSQAHRVFSSIPAFSFRLDAVGCFDKRVVFLRPAVPDPFVALTTAIAGEFPDYPPFGGRHSEIVPHLTVSVEPDVVDPVSSALHRRLQGAVGIESRCTHITLLENSSGRWVEMCKLDLQS
ncbi:2'-5' RNA ligase family protein [Pandoraea pulmonicola]|uniref:2'-5' RNA ligase n=1 Tax=Pandoraea pulmonicola TaxID=93221 RepID=A0AAJ4ZES7_PANPU|nr:2'-5' RNA ligase family protein [Pandoraea pulmonicola]AJC19846.1 hypothetical protein RO07_03930 [Pandoraea pulmonicola]SUA91974.1 Uncharacterised protein [Pandoraea pulmonicola]